MNFETCFCLEAEFIQLIPFIMFEILNSCRRKVFNLRKKPIVIIGVECGVMWSDVTCGLSLIFLHVLSFLSLWSLGRLLFWLPNYENEKKNNEPHTGFREHPGIKPLRFALQ